jgi:hypothetical protein
MRLRVPRQKADSSLLKQFGMTALKCLVDGQRDHIELQETLSPSTRQMHRGNLRIFQLPAKI